MKIKILGMIGFLSFLLLSGCTASNYTIAERHLKQKEYVEALRAYLQALQPHIREGKRWIYYEKEAVTGIGVVYWSMQRYETAIKVLNLVRERDPGYGKPYFYAGLCYEALGKEDQAIGVYSQYERIEPSDPFRQVLAGRLDYLSKRKVVHDISEAFQKEFQLDIAQYPEKSIAVLPFVNLTDSREWDPLQKGLAELVTKDLRAIGLVVVDRLKTERLFEQLRMNLSSLEKPEEALRFGKMVGARYLLKGSYLIMGDFKMTLDASVIPLENLSGATSFPFNGTLAQLFQLEKDLVLRVASHLGATLTPSQKTKVLEIPTQNLDAFLQYCRALQALDNEDYVSASSYFRRAVDLDPRFQQAKDWCIVPEIWMATHTQNLFRVDREVSYLTRPTAEGRLPYAMAPDLVSPEARLQWMGIRQKAAVLLTNDTRKAFPEAEVMGAPILPELLGEPPSPPLR